MNWISLLSQLCLTNNCREKYEVGSLQMNSFNLVVTTSPKDNDLGPVVLWNCLNYFFYEKKYEK